jgi:hypothetical protein
MKRYEYTEKRIERLKLIYADFFGICHFCGFAGHVDQLYELDNGDLVETCDTCLIERWHEQHLLP